jgi:benzoate 4-monooxygenase
MVYVSDPFRKIEQLNRGLPTTRFMSFDITGNLLFNAPLGMLEAGSDLVKVSPESSDKPIYVSMMKSLAQRSAAVATLGVLPWLRPHARHLPDPFFTNGMHGLENLMGIVMDHARERKNGRHSTDHEDWLSLLLEGRDDKGEPLRLEEVASEGLTLFIAAIETVSNTLSAMMYHLATSPDVLRKVQAEVDSAVPLDVIIPSFESVRGLPYLDAVINETMRLLSVIGLGLPREIPPNSKGHRFNGFYFAPGTVLSVPIYTIHRLNSIWGPDSEQFKPERFFKLTSRQKAAFIPFGAGPAACVGRNLAEVEMKIIAATWIRRYAVHMGEEEVRWTEGTTRKFLTVNIGIKRRNIEGM